MQQDVVQGEWQGGVVAMNHHGRGVAHQADVNAGLTTEHGVIHASRRGGKEGS